MDCWLVGWLVGCEPMRGRVKIEGAKPIDDGVYLRFLSSLVEEEAEEVAADAESVAATAGLDFFLVARGAASAEPSASAGVVVAASAVAPTGG